MASIQNLKNYLTTDAYKNLVNAVGNTYESLKNDPLQLLNIHSSLMNALHLSIEHLEMCEKETERFVLFYQQFIIYAETFEPTNDEQDDEEEIVDKYSSFLLPYLIHFVALSKEKDLLIKYHKKHDPKGYKKHIQKLEEIVAATQK